MELSPAFAATLGRLAEVMAGAEGDWAVIGGAAMVLLGLGGAEAKDIDVLVAEPVAEALRRRLGLANLAEGGAGRFRSRVLLHPPLGPVPVEVFAGFEVFAEARWQAVPVPEGGPAPFGPRGLRVAGPADLARLFGLFGRPKDLARARRLPGAG